MQDCVGRMHEIYGWISFADNNSKKRDDERF